MKKTLTFFTLLFSFALLFLSSSSAKPLQTSSKFVQFRIVTIAGAEAAATIDNKIGSKSGIIESRTDHITSTYFCLMARDAEYTQEDFVTWFGKMGYKIVCYTTGIQNVDPVVSPHVLKDCEDSEGK